MTDPITFVVGLVCLVVGAALVYFLLAGKSGSKLRDAEAQLASARSEADLLDIRNFGAKSISEIKDKLAELGLSLKGSPVDYISDDDYANPTFSDENQA